MAQTTTLSTATGGPQTPAARAAQTNAILAALFSDSSGPSAPSAATAFMRWLDTSADPAVLKMRNAANDAWVSLGTLSAAGAWVPAIAGLSIVAGMLAADAVTEAKIAANAVTSGKIANGAVGSSKLASGAATTEKIADLNVTTGKLADNAVSSAKMTTTGVTPASYAAANITVDAAGRVLEASNGTAGLSGLEFIGSIALSGSQQSLTGIPASRALVLFLNAAAWGSDGQHLRLQLSSNNGGTYGSNRQISGPRSGSATFGGRVEITRTAEAGQAKLVAPVAVQAGGSVYMSAAIETGVTGIIDALRLSPAGGNFSGGTVEVYGLR